MTTNYGLAGGTLDGTRHIEAAVDRLCFPEEAVRWRGTIDPALMLKVATYPVQQHPGAN